MPQPWVVERSFGWLEKCRRLWKNCERQLNTSLQLVNFFLPRFNIEKVLKIFRTGSYKCRVTNVPASALGPAMNGALKVYQS